jgi:hypothetical protein
MATMKSEVYAAFRELDISEEKALKAAEALSKRDDDVSELKTDMTVTKWMMGFILAFQVAIIIKLFVQ